MAKRFCTQCGKELTHGAFCTACGAHNPEETYTQRAAIPQPPIYNPSVYKKPSATISPLGIVGIALIILTFILFTASALIAGAAFMEEAPPELVAFADTLLGGKNSTAGIMTVYGLCMFIPAAVAIVSAILIGVKKLYGIGAALPGAFMIISTVIAVIAMVIVMNESEMTIARNYTFILVGVAYLAGVIASIWTFVPSVIILIIAQVKKKR